MKLEAVHCLSLGMKWKTAFFQALQAFASTLLYATEQCVSQHGIESNHFLYTTGIQFLFVRIYFYHNISALVLKVKRTVPLGLLHCRNS